MRILQVLTLLLGLALLVSAGRERIDDGYSYRKLTEESGENDVEVLSIRSGSSSKTFARSKSTIMKKADGSYDKTAYLATLYYYNSHYKK